MKSKIISPAFSCWLSPRHNILPNTNSICCFGAMASSVVLVQWMVDFNQLNAILIMFSQYFAILSAINRKIVLIMMIAIITTLVIIVIAITIIIIIIIIVIKNNNHNNHNKNNNNNEHVKTSLNTSLNIFPVRQHKQYGMFDRLG